MPARKLLYPLGIFLMLGPVRADAGNPESMILKYDTRGDRLAVEVYHRTEERFKHYINSYLVSVNEGPAQRFFQQGQTSTSVTLKDLRVQAADGDTLTVTAECTRGGIISGELILTDKYREERTGVYQVIIEDPDLYRGRPRDKVRGLRGYPSHHLHRRKGRHHHAEDAAQGDNKSEPAKPAVELNSAQKHRQEVEQDINRKAYEAKFGPLKTPADD